MSVRVIVPMDVDDYDNWSTTFNSEAGLIVEGYRNLDNPKNMIVIETAPSKEAFLKFFTSPEQKERMQSAGVISKPTVTFLEN